MRSRPAWPRVVAGVFLAAALVWGLSHYGATETWALYSLFLSALVPALAVLWTLPAELVRNVRFLPFLAVGFFLLGGIVLRPTLEGQGYVLAALGWLTLFTSLGLSFENRRAARRIFLFLILAGGLEAGIGLVEAAGGAGRPVTGTLFNRNHYAGLLNMALPLAMGALYAGYTRRRAAGAARSEILASSWLFILSSSFMGLAVLLSLSRGGTLTLAGALLFLSLALTLKRRRSSGPALSGLATATVLVTVLGLGLAVGLYALWERFGALSDLDLTEGRTAVYLDSLKLIGDHPVAGVGPGMFRWSFRPYQTVHLEKRFDHAHNDYLESAAEWGLPAALALWVFIAWRFYRSTRIFLRSRDPWRQGMALGSAGAIFSILLHSLVDFNLQIPANLMVFCMILGLAWSLDSRRSGA